MTTPRKQTAETQPEATRSPLLAGRRHMYQQYAHLMKVRDMLHNDRKDARKHKRLDEVMYLTEAIFHNAKCTAYLNSLSRKRYHCDLEDLAVYK